MNVTRVHDDRGSHIEPALDPTWPVLTMLEWLAAVAEVDSGLRVQVYESAPHLYAITVGGNSSSGRSGSLAWEYLTGVIVGAQEVHRATAPDPPVTD